MEVEEDPSTRITDDDAGYDPPGAPFPVPPPKSPPSVSLVGLFTRGGTSTDPDYVVAFDEKVFRELRRTGEIPFALEEIPVYSEQQIADMRTKGIGSEVGTSDEALKRSKTRTLGRENRRERRKRRKNTKKENKRSVASSSTTNAPSSSFPPPPPENPTSVPESSSSETKLPPLSPEEREKREAEHRVQSDMVIEENAFVALLSLMALPVLIPVPVTLVLFMRDSVFGPHIDAFDAILSLQAVLARGVHDVAKGGGKKKSKQSKRLIAMVAEEIEIERRAFLANHLKSTSFVFGEDDEEKVLSRERRCEGESDDDVRSRFVAEADHLFYVVEKNCLHLLWSVVHVLECACLCAHAYGCDVDKFDLFYRKDTVVTRVRSRWLVASPPPSLESHMIDYLPRGDKRIKDDLERRRLAYFCSLHRELRLHEDYDAFYDAAFERASRFARARRSLGTTGNDDDDGDRGVEEEGADPPDPRKDGKRWIETFCKRVSDEKALDALDTTRDFGGGCLYPYDDTVVSDFGTAFWYAMTAYAWAKHEWDVGKEEEKEEKKGNTDGKKEVDVEMI